MVYARDMSGGTRGVPLNDGGGGWLTADWLEAERPNEVARGQGGWEVPDLVTYVFLSLSLSFSCIYKNLGFN